MIKIVQKLCPPSKYNIKCPYEMDPEFITIHNTANDASAKNEITYMIGNNNQTSFHFAVDDQGAYQGLPLDRNGWHASDGGKGTGNRKSIAIEVCYSKSGGARHTKAVENAAELTAHLLDANDLTIDKVKTHEDWAKKHCPHRILDEYGWDKFIKLVQKNLKAIQKDTTVVTKSALDVAKEVLAGKWGNGATRKSKLEAAGYNYGEVQGLVNDLVNGKKPAAQPATPAPAKKSNEEIAKEVLNGKWGNGADRKKKLEAAGYNYSDVQAIVDKLVKGQAAPKPAKKSNVEIAREVLKGKWGNGADRKKRLTAAGYNYAAIQKLVNQMS